MVVGALPFYIHMFLLQIADPVVFFFFFLFLLGFIVVVFCLFVCVCSFYSVVSFRMYQY